MAGIALRFDWLNGLHLHGKKIWKIDSKLYMEIIGKKKKVLINVVESWTGMGKISWHSAQDKAASGRVDKIGQGQEARTGRAENVSKDYVDKWNKEVQGDKCTEGFEG